jgi:hypothetical protein
MRGQHDQIKPVWYFINAIFDCNAGHKRGSLLGYVHKGWGYEGIGREMQGLVRSKVSEAAA